MNQQLSAVLLLLFICCNNATKSGQEPPLPKKTTVIHKRFSLENQVGEAKRYIQRKGLNQRWCFLIDMSVPSGKKRFFVYDLTKDSVVLAGLVAHGSCNTGGAAIPQFSNIKGSGCSALGKYRIGYKYQGRFGHAYKLFGLDSSNSNAFERAIVLHSYACVPDYELLEAHICNSLGCPMVSPNFFKKLEQIIDTTDKPILMWIFNRY